jgi:PAS domain S-box-containing protein
MSIDEIVALKERIAKLESELAETKERQLALRDKVTHFRTIFKAIPAAAIVTNTDRLITMVNPAAERVFGYSPQELLGHTTEKLYVSSDEYKAMGRARFNSAAAEQLKPYESYYRKKSGEIFPGETVGTPLLMEDGKAIGFLGIINDISERVELLQLTRDVHEQLELRIREGTAEFRALTDTLSHDLKNPIIAVKGFASLLQKRLSDSGDKKSVEFTNRIVDAVDWAYELLNDLKELCGSRDAKLHITEIDLKQLIQKVVSLEHGTIEAAGVEITVGADMPMIYADEHLLRRVLENLMGNALKFMPKERPPKISIHAEAGENDVTIAVRDSGDGIAPENVKKIFAPFFRLNEDVDGIGLGLDITRRFVELHGGKIWAVPNDQLEGASFNFTIPLSLSEHAQK